MLVFSIALILPSVLGLGTSAYRRGSGSSISVPVSPRFNTNRGLNIADADRAHVRSLIANARKPIDKLKPRQDVVPITDKAVTYTISIGVGSPPTSYELIVDTGSSNTWVGANKPYVPTSTSSDTENSVNVSYGSGSFAGEQFHDQLTLGDFVFYQNIGVANTSTGFSDVDGILGIGPTDLTQNTVAGVDSVPTVVDSLYAQGLINENLVSVFFQPTLDNNNPEGTGTLNFGGIDETVGFDISYTPITKTSPASNYWGIDQSVSFNTATPILSQTAGIVDTGTTLVLLASDAFTAYQKATGASLDNDTGLLTVSERQFLELPPLLFKIGGTTFEFTADAQAWPQQLNAQIGGKPDSIYLIVSDLGTPSGQGLDFINGQTFLQRFYSVYDTGNQRVGLSLTNHTFDVVNVPYQGFVSLTSVRAPSPT